MHREHHIDIPGFGFCFAGVPETGKVDGRKQRQDRSLPPGRRSGIQHICGCGEEIAGMDAQPLAGVGVSALYGTSTIMEEVFIDKLLFSVPDVPVYGDKVFPRTFHLVFENKMVRKQNEQKPNGKSLRRKPVISVLLCASLFFEMRDGSAIELSNRHRFQRAQFHFLVWLFPVNYPSIDAHQL